MANSTVNPAIPAIMQDETALFSEIQRLLGEAVLAETITDLQVIAYLHVFAEAKDLTDLWILVKLCEPKIPQFTELLEKAEEHAHAHAEQEVHSLLDKLIKTNPKLAAKVSAAVEQKQTLPEIMQAFPELSELSPE